MTTLKRIDNSYIDKYATYKNVELVRNTNNIVYNQEICESLKLNQISECKTGLMLTSATFLTILSSLINLVGISNLISNIVLFTFVYVLYTVIRSA